ncbi:hypothetical protein GOBAR_DD06570 [Gossypium barbadense]|nr:hypothetical protein GOBAR_DD06570 [Gossypium barbadense]
MEKSSGVESLGRDEISLLAKELVQSSIKSSMVVPTPKSRYEDGMFKCHNEGDIQEEGSVMENIERLNGIDSILEDKSKSVKKTSWKIIRPGVMMNQVEEESIMRKRK